MGKQNYVEREHRSKEFRSHTLHLGLNRAARRALAKQREHAGKETWANNPYRRNADGSLGPSAI